MTSNEQIRSAEGQPEHHEANFELVSGNKPHEIRALIQLLKEMQRKKKCEALGDWIKDHASPAPKEREEVQKLEARLETLEKLLHQAEIEGRELEVEVPAKVRLRSKAPKKS